MILELIILMEILAFAFLALGILPIGKTSDLEGNTSTPPYLNKIIFIFIACIIFFALGMLTVEYQYSYCYINATWNDYSMNKTLSSATCGNYLISNTELSFLNFGLGGLSIVLILIMSLLAGLNKHNLK